MSLRASQLYDEPNRFRLAVLESRIVYANRPVYKGAHFYIHPTAVCDVACTHCMYGSDQTLKRLAHSRLSEADVDLVLQYITDGRPDKLTISGGGEPLLEHQTVLRIVAGAACPNLEIITAANWARSRKRAHDVMGKLAAAVRMNPESPTLMIRASIDRFHLTAPNPVPIEAYRNLMDAWREHGQGIELGFRGLLLAGDDSLDVVARALGGTIEAGDSWNASFRVGDVTIPITSNVMRFAGKGTRYKQDLKDSTRRFEEYFAPFEHKPGTLLLGSAINDAIRGRYPAAEGLSITINFDGSLHVFTATSPDRYANIRTHTFFDSVDWFYRDPLTRILLQAGPYWLCDVVRLVDPALVEAALDANDIVSLVDTLLCDPHVLAFATLAAVQALASQGEIVDASAIQALAGMLEMPLVTVGLQVAEARSGHRASR